MNIRSIGIFGLLLFVQLTAFSQNKKITLPPNWYNLDLVADGYFGISTEKAYKELLSGLQPKQKIVVAVIDGGIEPTHEDLKEVMWVNRGEIPGNGIDDDNNGYIDDVNGWNFIGSSKGNLAYDNLELIRIYRKFHDKYRSTIRSTVLDSAEKIEYRLYTKVTAEFGRRYDEAHQTFRVLTIINKVLDSVAKVHNSAVPTFEQVEAYVPDDEEEEQVKKIIRSGTKDNGSFEKFYKEIKDGYKQYDVMLKYNLNPEYDPRAELVGDDYANSAERIYGNPDVKGPNADHGSHVAGIIGAVRGNGKGIDGISNYVSIMAIRVVPEGDERDKDVANGIRYAVDNGAKIINMSFGKGYKWDKKAVDDAVKYAEQKGVLLVHAAGNDNEDVDVKDNFPTKYYESPEFLEYEKKKRDEIAKILPLKNSPNPTPSYGPMGRPMGNRPIAPPPIDTARFKLPHATNWIEVGASAYHDDADLKASFSNYGKHNVDVFAPGFMIKSAVPDSKYEEFDGTSMAAPMVSGLAAMILSYYPKLTPQQVREIIMKSVVKVDRKVKFSSETAGSSRIKFSELCVSSGIVNAYNAMKLAATY